MVETGRAFNNIKGSGKLTPEERKDRAGSRIFRRSHDMEVSHKPLSPENVARQLAYFQDYFVGEGCSVQEIEEVTRNLRQRVPDLTKNNH